LSLSPEKDLSPSSAIGSATSFSDGDMGHQGFSGGNIY
jgi:hypothetical protein